MPRIVPALQVAGPNTGVETNNHPDGWVRMRGITQIPSATPQCRRNSKAELRYGYQIIMAQTASNLRAGFQCFERLSEFFVQQAKG